MIIKMPRWQSYMATTTKPMFSPQQCQDIINAGHAEKPQVAQVGMNKPGGGVDKKKRTTTRCINILFYPWIFLNGLILYLIIILSGTKLVKIIDL